MAICAGHGSRYSSPAAHDIADATAGESRLIAGKQSRSGDVAQNIGLGSLQVRVLPSA